MIRSGPPSRLVAIVPVGALDGAKSRLGGVLDPEERRDLALRMLTRTIVAACEASVVDGVVVVSPDPEVLAIAGSLGVHIVRQRGHGLNDGVREGRDHAVARAATAVVVLPIDLVRITATAIEELVAPALARTNGRPLVVLVTDRHGRGTNALVLAPPDAIEPRFGGDSRAAHAACAAEAGADYREVGGPLALDVDTPDDLLLADELVHR